MACKLRFFLESKKQRNIFFEYFQEGCENLRNQKKKAKLCDYSSKYGNWREPLLFLSKKLD